MSDAESAKVASDRINEHLASENERLERELREVRAMLGRPVTVNVTGPEGATLQKIGEYLPQLTHLSTNVAEVAGKLVGMSNNQQSANVKLDTLSHTLDRIADALDRAFPVVPDPQWNQDAEDRLIAKPRGSVPGTM